MKFKFLLLIVFLLTGVQTLFAAAPPVISSSKAVATAVITGNNLINASPVAAVGEPKIPTANTGTKFALNGSGAGAGRTFFKAAPVITFNPITVTYGAADIDPGATSTNPTIPIVYTTSDASVAVVVNNKIHIKKAGLTKIIATQPGNASYPTVSANHYLTINKTALTIKADDKTSIVGKPLPALTATYTGLVYGETAANLITQPTLSTTATTSSTVGTYPITASGATSNNYTITYSPGMLTLQPVPVTPVISFNAQTVTYGAADIDPGATSTNTTSPIVYSSSDTSVAVIVNNKVHIKKVGQTRVIASQVASSGYNAASTNHFFTINKVALNIKADDKNGTAGNPLPVLTATYTGFVYGETAANLTTKPTLTTTATSSSAIGTYPITASGAVSNNYTITYSPGTLALQSANPTPQTITYNQPATVRYGTSDITPDVTSTNNTIPVMLTSSDTTIASIINGKIRIKRLGVTKITVTQNGNLYYSAAKPVSHYITVVKALLSIKADNKTGIAGQPLPALTVTYQGFVNGENVSSLSTLPVVNTTATTTSPAGTYPIKASGAIADNYIIAYADGTLTLTAPAVPAITSFSPTVTPTGGLVNIIGTNLNNVTSFTVNGKAGIIVSKTAAKLVGLVMPGSTAGKITVSTGSNTATSAGDLAIAPNPVPNAQFGDKFVGTGNSGPATQGNAIASSADGTTIVVGGTYDNNGMGAAWIYTRNSTGFVQQGAKLIGTGGAGASQLQQGRSVAISADGNTVIIGGAGDNNNAGALWVFTRTGTTWTQQGTKLVGSGNIGAANMGASVAVSADGNTVIAGGYNDNGNIGAAWVFTRKNNVWAQQGAKLVGNDSYVKPGQGVSVAISADGNTAVVGGQADFNGVGASWVYTRTGDTWAQQGSKLIGSGYAGASRQGIVSISADGTTILIGGYGDNNNKGAAWVFTRNGTSWVQQGSKLVGIGGVLQDTQGWAVALNADGNTAVVGGPGTGSNKGNTWMFKRTGTNWQAYGGRLLGTASSAAAHQGYAVAISTNGRTLFIGAPYENNNNGAAWAFVNGAKFSSTIDVFQHLDTVNYGTPDVQMVATSTNTTTPIIFSSSDTTVAKVIAGSKLHITGGGTATITASQPGNATYSDAVPVTQTITVNKVPLTITPNNIVVVRGTANPDFTFKYQGFVNGDTAKNLTVKPIATTTATDSSPAGLYTLTASGAVSSSYTFIYKPGVLTLVESVGPPQVASIVPRSGPVGGLITINGANLYNSKSLIIGGKNALIISNTGSKLVGMVMPGAVSGPITLNTDSASITPPGNFTVIPVSPPTVQQGAKMEGTSATGIIGSQITMSADGNTAAVSAAQGVVVYARFGNSWEQQAILTPADEVGASGFGSSIAINADGNTVIIGGPGDSGDKGAAWIFVRKGASWQQGPKLVSDQLNVEKRQGTSVAISGDGNTAVLGDPGIAGSRGGVLVFKRFGESWLQEGGILIGKGANGAYMESYKDALQGYRVAISADGKTIASVTNSGENGFWPFVFDGGSWKQQGLRQDFAIYPNFSQNGPLAITADGNELLVPGYLKDQQLLYYDEVNHEYIYADAYYSSMIRFKRTGERWDIGSFIGNDYGEGASNVKTVTSVATSADRQIFAVSVVSNDHQGVYVLSSSTSDLTDLVPSDGNSTVFGLSADGSTAAISNISEGSYGALRFFVSSIKSAQYITFNQPGPFTVGTADVTLAATSINTTLPINFSSSDTTVASIVNNKLHIKTTGVTTITASQDDDNISPVSRDVTINQASFATMAAGNPALAYSQNQNGDGSGDTQKTVVPYPNPFVSGVKLNLGDNMISNASVNVYELSESGKLVYANQYNNTSGVVQLNLDNLKSGLYVLKLTTGKQVKVFKIMKR